MEKELKELGLSEYEIRAYSSLIREGVLTGNKASKASSVPQGKIYDTLYRLGEKGFISIINSKPKMFKAINPEIAIKQHISKKIAKLEQIGKVLPEEIKKLKIDGKDKTETDEKVSVFRGKKNAFAPAQYILDSAKKSINMMFTFEAFMPLTRRILVKKQKQKVNIRILATKKANYELIKEVMDMGFKVRYFPVEELRIIIKDETESVIQVVNPKDLLDRTNVLIQSRELSKALTYYFDRVWEKAEVLK